MSTQEDNLTKESEKTRVISYGLGPIGLEVAKIVLHSTQLELVGAVDIDTEKLGEDLGILLGLNQKIGVRVTDDLSRILESGPAEVVVHTTSSSFKKVFPQIRDIVSKNLNCISSSEELFFPYFQNPHLSQQIDTLAKRNKVTVLGTGINPGFLMDTLPIFLTTVCQKVEEIKVERVVDVSTRRFPLQKKVGLALAPEVFRDQAEKKLCGHVGLPETLDFIACSLGWHLDKIEEEIDPIVADKELSTEYFTIPKGFVAGMKHTISGIGNGRKLINLNLQMYVGAKNPHDLVVIKGDPNVKTVIEGGVPGDESTAAVLTNVIPSVVRAKPGLVTMKDLSLTHIIESSGYVII